MGCQSPRTRRGIRQKYPRNFNKIIAGMNTGLLNEEPTDDQKKEFKEAILTLVTITIAETSSDDLYLLLIASKKAYQKLSSSDWKEKTQNQARESKLSVTPYELIANDVIEFAETNTGIRFKDRNTAKASLIEAISEEEAR